MTARRMQRGDTIIEVLLGITIFSLVAVGGFSIVNRATNTVQTSLEITQVRAQIDAQADMLRMLHQAYSQVYKPGATYAVPAAAASEWEYYPSLWKQITTTGSSGPRAKTTPATAISDVAPSGHCTTPPDGSFALNPRQLRQPITSFNTAPATYARIQTTTAQSDGMWIEAVSVPGKYTDFHIYACWDTVGASVPQTIGTIVRLYEPTN